LFVSQLRQNAASVDEHQARGFVRNLVLALQASLLIRHAPAAIADAFCVSRLTDGTGVFGALPATVDTRAIVSRAAPMLS
jgi:putative acyl-CoA dehydrogenase